MGRRVYAVRVTSDATTEAGLRAWGRDLAAIEAGVGLLQWDRDTAMRAGSADDRASVFGALAAIHHRELVRADVEPLLSAAERRPHEPRLAAIVTAFQRQRRRALRLPESLVSATAEASSRCLSAWTVARRTDDFPSFAEAFAPLLALKRREGELLEIGDEPYDGLIDEYEPGARASEIAPILTGLAERLRALLTRVPQHEPDPLPPVTWPATAQLELANALAVAVGHDPTRGYVAISAHPMSCTIHAGDVRITTRVNKADPAESILSVMHELGHALYEQHLPRAFIDTPVFSAASLAAHESQARFFENHVGRTPAFWRWVEPLLREHFPLQMRGVSVDLLAARAQAVRPSLIRTEADEVTYNLHVAVRFELELALIRGDLDVLALPSVWRERMRQLVGIAPTSDADGVLQDMHWADGTIGYFPTYALGNLYAAQLAAAASATLGPIEEVIGRHGLSPLVRFMRERIHEHGAGMPTNVLMERATGGPLSSDACIRDLERRYLRREDR